MPQHGQYPSTYYRVSLKAIIRNDKNEVLCVKENGDWWELPGGGIEHGEDVMVALKRELAEEIDYHGNLEYSLNDIITLYDAPRERCMMLIGIDVSLLDAYTITAGPDVKEAVWLDPHQLSDEDARASRSIYKFTVDPNYTVDFVRNYH